MSCCGKILNVVRTRSYAHRSLSFGSGYAQPTQHLTMFMGLVHSLSVGCTCVIDWRVCGGLVGQVLETRVGLIISESSSSFPPLFSERRAVFVIGSTDYFSCTCELLPESGGSLGVDSRVRVGHVIRHVCLTARGVALLAGLRGE